MAKQDEEITLLTMAGRITDTMRSMQADSLVEYTKGTRVEPITLLDSSLREQPYITDILQSIVNMVSGYYLQAVAISSNVGQINVVKLLDKLSPNRSPAEAAAGSAEYWFGRENYQYGLPGYGIERRDEIPRSKRTISDKQFEKISDSVDLSVGKMLSVEIEESGHTATIPVMVRLLVKSSLPEDIVQIVSYGSKDTSAKERYHQWRAGEIEFIKDIIMCNDLIDSHKKALMRDKDGFYNSMLNRRSKNRLATLFSGQPSVNTASAVIIISKDSLKRVERNINGQFKNPTVRNRIFKNTATMLFVVVDTQWEQATIYHRGIDMPTRMTVKEFKRASKGGDVDVMEVLKAYQLGQAPQF